MQALVYMLFKLFPLPRAVEKGGGQCTQRAPVKKRNHDGPAFTYELG